MVENALSLSAISVKRDLLQYQKRLITVAKGTYYLFLSRLPCTHSLLCQSESLEECPLSTPPGKDFQKIIQNKQRMFSLYSDIPMNMPLTLV
jgi:hypothetical protein